MLFPRMTFHPYSFRKDTMKRSAECGPYAVLVPPNVHMPFGEKTSKKKKINIMERWTACTQCKYVGQLPMRAKYFISGNYFGEALCAECLSMREVRCGQCMEGTGMYVHLGRDPHATTMPSIICMGCIMAERKKFEEK